MSIERPSEGRFHIFSIFVQQAWPLLIQLRPMDPYLWSSHSTLFVNVRLKEDYDQRLSYPKYIFWDSKLLATYLALVHN